MIEFNALQEHLLSWHSKTAKTIFVPIQHVVWWIQQKSDLEELVDKLQFNQWRNTDPILKWFNNKKSNFSFIRFGIKEFYPWISENILQQTLKFAKQHTNIDKNDLGIINHFCKLLLFSADSIWKKKSTDSCWRHNG